MITKFIYRKSLEYERIYVIFSDIIQKLYQNNGFIVLPYQLKGHPKSIYLPRIKKFNAIDFLPQFRKSIIPNIPLKKSKGVEKVIERIKKCGFKPKEINIRHFKHIEKKWRNIQDLFEDYFLDIFSKYRRYRIIFEVYGTRYGSLVSFSEEILKGKNATIRIFLRDDMGIAQIVEGFVSSFFRDRMSRKYRYSFIQREAIIDFLIQDTKLRRLCKDYFPTLSSYGRSRDLHKYYKDSLKYLGELGFSSDTGLSVNRNSILINGALPKYPFSPSEKLILKRMIMSPNETISYYELGDLLWKNNGNKFSLWAITRLIYKIRKKLSKNNLSSEHIKNLKGKGYYFTPQP